MFHSNLLDCGALRCVLAFLCISSSVLLTAQALPPVPSTAVAIENTNAAFTPTEVDVPQANPARPTVTIPAHLPPTGFLQFEQGVGYAGSSPSGTNGQMSLSQVTKIAVTTRLLFQFLTAPYTYSTLAAADGSSFRRSDPGDLQIGIQGVLHKSVGALPTVSVGYIRRVRSGTSANVDLGAYSQSALVLLGGDLPGGIHYDSNIVVNEQNNGPIRRAQFLQTLALTHAIFPAATHQRLSGIIELSHFTQPSVTADRHGASISRPNTYDLLFVGTYTLRPNLILDASVNRGLTSTSTLWQAGFGFSYILPHRLWRDKHPVAIPVHTFLRPPD